MQVFKYVESAEYYEKLHGGVLSEKQVPKKIFDDLVRYDTTFFNMKGFHIFKKIIFA